MRDKRREGERCRTASGALGTLSRERERERERERRRPKHKTQCVSTNLSWRGIRLAFLGRHGVQGTVTKRRPGASESGAVAKVARKYKFCEHLLLLSLSLSAAQKESTEEENKGGRRHPSRQAGRTTALAWESETEKQRPKWSEQPRVRVPTFYPPHLIVVMQSLGPGRGGEGGHKRQCER